jgi:hypothetical protein
MNDLGDRVFVVTGRRGQCHVNMARAQDAALEPPHEEDESLAAGRDECITAPVATARRVAGREPIKRSSKR